MASAGVLPNCFWLQGIELYFQGYIVRLKVNETTQGILYLAYLDR